MLWEQSVYNFGKKSWFFPNQFKHSYSLSNNLKSSISGNVLYPAFRGIISIITAPSKALLNTGISLRKKKKEKENNKNSKRKRTPKSQSTKEIYPMAGGLGCRMLKWPLNAENEIWKTKLVIHLGLYILFSFLQVSQST